MWEELYAERDEACEGAFWNFGNFVNFGNFGNFGIINYKLVLVLVLCWMEHKFVLVTLR